MGKSAVEELDYLFDETSTETAYSEEEYKMILDSIRVPKVGYSFECVYIGDDKDDYLLDGSFKDLVRVPKNKDEKMIFDNVEVNTTVPVTITGISEQSNGFSIDGSVSILYKQETHRSLSELDSNSFVNVVVNSINPAGYSCHIIGDHCSVEAFLPQFLAGVNKIHDNAKEDIVGETLEMCVESYSSEKGTWIVSRRGYLQQLIPQYTENLDASVTYTGHVTGTTKFGVFVEFNECLTGLIHKTNLDADMLNRFENRSIQSGEEVSFKVKEVIKKGIILTQIDNTSLWDTIDKGQVLMGSVKGHIDIGTLVDLDHDMTGLVRGSGDLSHLLVGDEIEVKVTSVNRNYRKVNLELN